MFGYEGNVMVIADGGPGFCSASPAVFDSFRAGTTVDGTELQPLCIRVHDFTANYLDSGLATSFTAHIDYQAGDDLAADHWRPYLLEVNHPLRVGGARAYLQGHGYAPTFTVLSRDGQTRTQTVQFRPDNPLTRCRRAHCASTRRPACTPTRPRGVSTRSGFRARSHRPSNSTTGCCRRRSRRCATPRWPSMSTAATPA